MGVISGTASLIRTVASLVFLLIVAGVIYAAWQWQSGGIHNQVAADMIEKYEIAKRSGNAMDACVHAGFVAAAWLEAKNEAEYQRWKGTESDDCASAGLRREPRTAKKAAKPEPSKRTSVSEQARALADEMCACKAYSCADALAARWLGVTSRPVPANESKEMEAQMARFQKCQDVAYGPK